MGEVGELLNFEEGAVLEQGDQTSSDPSIKPENDIEEVEDSKGGNGNGNDTGDDEVEIEDQSESEGEAEPLPESVLQELERRKQNAVIQEL